MRDTKGAFSSFTGLVEAVGHWLRHPGERAQAGERGRRVVEKNRGALGNVLAIIDRHLDRGAGVAPAASDTSGREA